MFPRRKRLSREVFSSALKTGRRVSSEHFSVIIPQHNEHGYAVVIPKKVAKLSVQRHQIKRRVLSALRALPLPNALIVFPRSSVSSVSYQDIKIELAKLLP